MNSFVNSEISLYSEISLKIYSLNVDQYIIRLFSNHNKIFVYIFDSNDNKLRAFDNICNFTFARFNYIAFKLDITKESIEKMLSLKESEITQFFSEDFEEIDEENELEEAFS